MSLQLEVRERNNWEASYKMRETCLDKGQSENDCHNFLMVLQSYGNKLYACGSYAYSPLCSWRQMENLTVTKYDKGVGKCPFNPHANITTLMTESGKIFVGSPTDFSGSDPAILRADISQVDSKMLRTNQYNSKWLNDPQFVGSFENGEFVYFIFRETAVEYINCGKVSILKLKNIYCKLIVILNFRRFIPELLVFVNQILVALIFLRIIGHPLWKLDWIARCPANILFISMKCKESHIPPMKEFFMLLLRHQTTAFMAQPFVPLT